MALGGAMQAVLRCAVEPKRMAGGPAARQTGGPLEARDGGSDAGAEVAELAIDPAAPDHVFDLPAAFLVEGHVADAVGLGPAQIVATGIAASAGRFGERRFRAP